MIKNYGLFWKREGVIWKVNGVDWGEVKPARGLLLGRKGSEPLINFCYQSGVYILHEGFRVIYVGQTGAGKQRLFKRLSDHTADHLAERWDRFSWFGVELPKIGVHIGKNNPTAWGIKPPLNAIQRDKKSRGGNETNVTLNVLEGVLISVTEPPLNRQGAAFGKDIKQYRQVDWRKLKIDAASEDED